MLSFYSGFQRKFFLIDPTDGSRRSRINKARALWNREHGSFHLRYSENGPLEPGYCLLSSHPKWKPEGCLAAMDSCQFQYAPTDCNSWSQNFIDSLSFPCHRKWIHLLSPQLPNFIYCHWSQNTRTAICNDIKYQKWENKLCYLCFILNDRVS